MQTRVILLNGAPSSGKDSIASYMCGQLHGLIHKEFKEKLFELVKVIYSVSDERFSELYKDKETPCEEYYGLSPRQVMIKVSEEVIKPVYGERYFGEQAAKGLVSGKTNIFSDSGFIEEAHPIIEKVGTDNILLLKIVDRGDFSEDSRGFLPESLFKNVSVVSNTGTLDSFLNTAWGEIFSFLGASNE